MSQTATNKSATPTLTWAEAEAGIRQLLSSGREKTALDRAKELHKTWQSAASEALVLDAYIARIRALSRQNLHLEAKSLLDLVRQRFPSAAARLSEAADSAAARAGELDQLLRPLADPSLAPDRRASIERLIEEMWSICERLRNAMRFLPIIRSVRPRSQCSRLSSPSPAAR